jgi:Histidine kinase
MSHAVWLSALLLFGFGAFAYGAVVAASANRAWRARGAGAPRFWAPDMAMSVLSLTWFVVNLTTLILSLDPTIRTPILESLELLLAFAFPPTILSYQFYGHPEGLANPGARLARVRRGLVALVALVAAATAIATVGPIFGLFPWRIEQIVPLSNSILGLLFVAAFSAGVLIGRSPTSGRPAPAPASALSSRVLSLVAALLSVPLAVHAFSGWKSPDVPLILLQSMPLFFLVNTSYHEERFEFFDLIVKRGLALVASLLAFVVWFVWALPAIGHFGPDAARPWLLALAVLPLVWLLPIVRGWIGRLVDRRLLGRHYSIERGYAELVDQVLLAMQPASTEAQLADEVSRAFSTFFAAPVTLHLGSAIDAAPGAPGIVRVPVTSGGERLGELQLGPRAQQAPWLSEDLALVGILADVCGYQVVTTRLREREALQAQRAQALELLASRSRLQALRAQVNPHFLFNALNAIAGLIHRDPELADRTVEKLAEVFRYTLRQSENEWAPFGAELAFVRAYLDVEQARFGGRLMITWDVERAPSQAHVPALALQTLVENAVKHGVARARGPAAIAVSAWAEESTLVIDVADTGAGFVPATPMGRLPPSRASGRFGLRSLQERLAGYFGDRAALTWRREGGRTHVRLTLPLVEREVAAPGSEGDGAPAERAPAEAPAS